MSLLKLAGLLASVAVLLLFIMLWREPSSRERQAQFDAIVLACMDRGGRAEDCRERAHLSRREEIRKGDAAMWANVRGWFGAE